MADSAFVKKQKKLYKKLKPCFCPALQEFVYFTSDGLNHLIYNRRRPRKSDERHYRAALIPHLRDIIKNSTKAVKEIKSTTPLVITWHLLYEIKSGNRKQIAKVVLKKEGVGKVKFLSAMRKKFVGKKSTKKPRHKA